jgi:hypothetical protein
VTPPTTNTSSLRPAPPPPPSPSPAMAPVTWLYILLGPEAAASLPRRRPNTPPRLTRALVTRVAGSPRPNSSAASPFGLLHTTTRKHSAAAAQWVVCNSWISTLALDNPSCFMQKARLMSLLLYSDSANRHDNSGSTQPT